MTTTTNNLRFSHQQIMIPQSMFRKCFTVCGPLMTKPLCHRPALNFSHSKQSGRELMTKPLCRRPALNFSHSKQSGRELMTKPLCRRPALNFSHSKQSGRELMTKPLCRRPALNFSLSKQSGRKLKVDQSASIGYYQARQGREMFSSLSATKLKLNLKL